MPPKKKLKRNLTGLRNQLKPCQDEITVPSDELSTEVDDEKMFDEDIDAGAGEASDHESDVGHDNEGMEHADGIEHDGMQVAMMMVAASSGDDPRDEDWVPPRL